MEEGMTTHSSILAWRIPWTEEPGRLQSMGLQSQTRLERLSREQRLIISDTPQELLSHGGKWDSRGSVNLSAQDPGPIPSSYSCVHPLKSVRRKESSICQSQHSWNLAQTSWDIYSLTLFSQGGMYGQSPTQGTSVLSGQVTQWEQRAS